MDCEAGGHHDKEHEHNIKDIQLNQSIFTIKLKVKNDNQFSRGVIEFLSSYPRLSMIDVSTINNYYDEKTCCPDQSELKLTKKQEKKYQEYVEYFTQHENYILLDHYFYSFRCCSVMFLLYNQSKQFVTYAEVSLNK